MSQQEELDRNEPATSYKLEKARRRGSIARSQDVTFAVVLLVATGCVYGLGESTLRELAQLVAATLARAGTDGLGAAQAMHLSVQLTLLALQIIAPLVFLLWLSAMLVSTAQARGVFTGEVLKPNFERLNPAANFKRLFSLRTVQETFKTVLKVALAASVVALWGWHHLEELIGVGFLTSTQLARRAILLLAGVLATVALVFAVIAYGDWLYARWDYLRQMRMSKREVREEHKEREGDPRIKARLRELRAEWSKRARSVRKAGEADVLLTNPTHYAVAVEYRHGEMPAPRVTAKGAGDLALRMRKEAARRGVPVVQNPVLARALFAQVEQEQFVPEEHFAALARILRWVYAGRRSARGMAG